MLTPVAARAGADFPNWFRPAAGARSENRPTPRHLRRRLHARDSPLDMRQAAPHVLTRCGPTLPRQRPVQDAKPMTGQKIRQPSIAAVTRARPAVPRLRAESGPAILLGRTTA